MTRWMLPFALLLTACGGLDPQAAADSLEQALVAAVEDDAVRHGVLLVDAPRKDLSGTWAAGVADAETGAAMTPDSPFLSASIGKLFVAATVFDLADDGVLGLDDPVSRWVPAAVLSGLPAHGGDAGFDAITLRMLLAHRSGLPDYFDTETHPAKDGAPGLAQLWVDEPDRTWSREQLLDYARQHWTAYAEPGEAFLYSDLNYDLLGLAIEGATRTPYPQVVRERVIDPLGLSHTWYHHAEPPPDGLPRHADAFYGDANLGRAQALSGDQAGGGLATTAGDLARFLRGLERGEPVALDRLATDWTPDALSRGLDYGYGAWRWRPGRIFFALGGLPELRGVSGSTNAFVYVTDDGTVVAGTFDQGDDPARHVQFVLSKVLGTVARVEGGD
jgi:D-alanyl-D-alanine carboxypeptidase